MFWAVWVTGFDLAEADEDHGAELKALAALHGRDIDLGFLGIVGDSGT